MIVTGSYPGPQMLTVSTEQTQQQTQLQLVTYHKLLPRDRPCHYRRSQEFVLKGALFRLEGSKFEAEGGRVLLGEGQRAPFPPVKGSGERRKLSQRGSGQAPTANAFGRTESPKTRLVAFCPVNLGFLGGGISPPVPSGFAYNIHRFIRFFKARMI